MLRLVLAVIVAASWTLAPQEAKEEGVTPPASQPTSQPAVRATPRSPEQARIFQELLRDTERPRAKPILSVSEDARSVAGDASLLPEGTVLIERPGRLVRSGERSEFHLKPDSPADGAPNVMEFNKNGLLEAMEAEAAAGVREFVISAEVTRYRGRNYLNLLKYGRRISHGNLGP